MNIQEYLNEVSGRDKKLNIDEYLANSQVSSESNIDEYLSKGGAPEPQKLPWYGKEPTEAPKRKSTPTNDAVEEYLKSIEKYRNPAASITEGLKGFMSDIPKTAVTYGGNLLTGFNRAVTAPVLGVLGEVVNKLNPFRPSYGSGVRPEGVPATIGPVPKEPLSVANIGEKISGAGDYIGSQSEELNNIIGEYGLDPNKHPELQRFIAGAGELTGMSPAFVVPGALAILGAITGANEARKSGEDMAGGAFTGATKGALDDIVFRKTGKLLPKNSHAKLASMLGFATVNEVSEAMETGKLSWPDVETAIAALTPLAMPGHGGKTKARNMANKDIRREIKLEPPTPEPKVEPQTPPAPPTEPWDIKSVIDRAKQYGITVPEEIIKKYLPEVAKHEVVAPTKLESATPATVITQTPLDFEAMKTKKFGGKQKVSDVKLKDLTPDVEPHGYVSPEELARMAAAHKTFGKASATGNQAQGGKIDRDLKPGVEFGYETEVGKDGKVKVKADITNGVPSDVIDKRVSEIEAELNKDRFFVGRKVVVRAPDARNKSDYAGEIVSAGMDWYGVKLNKDGSIKKVRADQMFTHNEYNGRDYYDNMPPEAARELKQRNKQIDETLWKDMPDIGAASDTEYKDFNAAQSKTEKTNLILKFMADRAGIDTTDINLKDPQRRVQVFDELMGAIADGRLSKVKRSDAVLMLSGTVDDPFSASQGVKKDWSMLQKQIRESEKNWDISKDTLKDVGQVVELFNKFIEKAKTAKATPITTESDEQFSMRQPGQKPYTPERPLVGIDLPELVQLTKELSGKFPRVKEKIKAGETGTAQGSFSESKKRINIEGALGSNTPEARSTLGHEIGHLVDYLAEKFPNTLKRGNLLGHIAAMKDYLRGMLPEFPGAEGELTAADRLLIRGEAINRAAKKSSEYKPDVDPKEILDVWNNVDARAKDPTLYDYVARLGKQRKIELIKSAINGIFPDWFTFKKNYGAASKTEKQFYDELIVKEIKKRGLYDLETMKAEAYALSKEWRPFDEKADTKYTAYRKKPSELYADMFSVLVNDPKLIEEKAPNFYKAFWAYLEERPGVKKSYEEMLGKINTGEHKADLEKRTFDMFKRGDKVREEIAKRSSLKGSLKENIRSTWGQVATYLEPLLHYQKIAKDINPMAESQSARYALERLLYTNSETDAMYRGFNSEVMEPLKKNGIDYETFRYYSLLNEVRSKTSPQKFTTLGWTPERATESLAKLESTMGSQKFALMMDAKNKMFTNVLKKFVLDNPEFEQAYGKELTDMFKSRPDYVTHSSIEHLEKMVGAQASGASTGRIFKRIGSFGMIEDPISATLNKYQSLIRSVRRNIAANELKEWLGKNLPDKVSEKKGGALDSEIHFMRDGKLQTFFVEAPIARMFEKNPLESNGITRIMGTLAKPFKAMFTTYNPGFYLTNPIRDYLRTVENVKGMTITNFAKYWFGSLPESRRFVKGQGNTPNVNRMFSQNMITSTVNKGWDAGDMETVRLLKKYDIGHHKNVIKRFFEGMTNILKVQEITTKMAGEKWLRERKPGMTEAERGHIVRTQVGTPDTLMRGDIGAFLNSAMLYYNVNLQGWRGNIEAAKDHPTEWAWKQVKYSVVPKIIMAAAAAGMLGDDTKKVMLGFSNYLKQNFHIIPIGLTKSGKSVGLSIPMDETQRVIGGLTDIAINKLFGNNDGRTLNDAIKFIEGQTMPGPNPIFSLLGDTLKYIYGEPITDSFRGNQALSDREMTAGGMRSLEKFGKYEFTKFFSVIKKFQSDTPGAVHGELEKILGLPIVGNPISRFIRVTDFGISEKLSAAQKEVKQTAANKSLDLDAAVKEKIAAGVKSKSDIITTYWQFIKDGIIDKKTTKYQFEKKFKRLERGETPLERQLIYSVSNDEKIAIIKRAKDLMNKNELNKLLKDYFDEGLINRDVYLKSQ